MIAVTYLSLAYLHFKEAISFAILHDDEIATGTLV